MPGAGRRRGITRGQLKQWMQALGIVYLLMFLPVSSYIKEDILSVYGEAGSGQEEEMTENRYPAERTRARGGTDI